MTTKIIGFLAALGLMAGAATAQSGFDLSKLDQIQRAWDTPAPDRIALGLSFLREELASPTPERWGVGGGPIDTWYIQEAIAGTLEFPGADAPGVLRDYRDHETDPRIKEWLTIALGESGQQDTVADLIRIAKGAKEGAMRELAVVALAKLSMAPAMYRLRPKAHDISSWKPLDPETRALVVATLKGALADEGFKRYRAPKRDDAAAFYPVQEKAAWGLRLYGFKVHQVSHGDLVTGWRVFDREGKEVHAVTLKATFHKAPLGEP